MRRKLELLCGKTHPYIKNITSNNDFNERVIIETMDQFQENTRIDYPNPYESHIRYSLDNRALANLYFRNYKFILTIKRI